VADPVQFDKPTMETEIRRLLDGRLPDADLLCRLEELAAAQRAFDGFTWLWGPILYRRARTHFRPFLRSRFSSFLVLPKWKFEEVRWKGAIGDLLDAWMKEVDRDDDIDLFRRLYRWRLVEKHGWLKTEKRWQEDLGVRFQEADSAARRQTVLAKFDIPYALDEPTAVGLYRVDPAGTPPFLLRHLAQPWTGKRVYWEKLALRALEFGNEDLHFAIYRRQIDLKRWQADALSLCEKIADPDQLNPELERRHPQGWSLDLGSAFLHLVEKRGREVFPYLMRRLADARNPWQLGSWFKSGYDKLLALAVARGWLDLWSGLIRACSSPGQYNAEVRTLIEDRALAPDETARRLVMLTGTAREWNFGGLGLALVRPLEDRVAVALHQRFPDLVRGPFRLHVVPGWGNAYPELSDRALATGDEDLVDWLASRLATHGAAMTAAPKHIAVAEKLSRRYQELRDRDPAAFARRAARVLTLVPAYAIYRYDALLRVNRLARLLFERSPSAYLADPAAMADLIEGSEIHVMAVAYRALGLDDPRARALAVKHLDLLLGTLLRPLQRRTRALAFAALANAAHDPAPAARVLKKAREALDLPDQRYPKEALVGLIGKLLHRHPDLRGERERPRVFERAVEQSSAPA